MCKYDVGTFCNFLKLNLMCSGEIVKIYNYIYIFSHFNQLICKLKTPSFSFRSSPASKQEDGHTNAIEALEGFVIGLYSDVFNAVISLINR